MIALNLPQVLINIDDDGNDYDDNDDDIENIRGFTKVDLFCLAGSIKIG